MSVVIGIDGGGSHARAVVVSPDGRELARVAGPAGIVDARDPGSAAEVIAQLAADALAAVRADAPAAALCCGLAGAGREREREAIRIALTVRGLAQTVLVTSDAEAAMSDAFGEGAGVLLIAGTGSIAWARAADGRVVRAGGWGALLGDDGSGYAIGLAGLRAVARAADGLEDRTALSAAAVEHARVGEPRELIAWAGAATKAQIAAFAPAVLQCAAAGDAAAARIGRAAVEALADFAAHVAAAAAPAAGERWLIALAGGLLAVTGPLRADVTDAVRRSVPGCSFLERDVDAALGAARLARAASPPSSGDD
jgi:glucosamine kinase